MLSLSQCECGRRFSSQSNTDGLIQRKTRCDVNLPRCLPCERANAHCEYFDQAKGTKIPRNFVVYLQHRVRSLEKQLADLEKEDLDPDPEDVVRPGAAVRIQEHDETKFLGPSSGIAITRLVMRLAKQITDAKSITDIVSETRAKHIKETFNEEGEKPTSKIYPLISDVAANELPQRNLTNLLVELFCGKGITKRITLSSNRLAKYLQSSPCIPSSTTSSWLKTSKPSTMNHKIRFKTLSYVW